MGWHIVPSRGCRAGELKKGCAGNILRCSPARESPTLTLFVSLLAGDAIQDARSRGCGKRLHGFGMEIARATRNLRSSRKSLCIHGGLADGSPFHAARSAPRREFFQQTPLARIRSLFIDLEAREGAEFYSAVGLLGRTWVDIEAEPLLAPVEHGFCCRTLAISSRLRSENRSKKMRALPVDLLGAVGIAVGVAHS